MRAGGMAGGSHTRKQHEGGCCKMPDRSIRSWCQLGRLSHRVTNQSVLLFPASPHHHIQCACPGDGPLLHAADGEAKVRQLKSLVDRQQDILQLDVAVHDAPGMQVL